MMDPLSAPAHFNLASIYDAAGEQSRAVEHYRAFLDHAAPDHASYAAEARGPIDMLTRSANR